MSEGHRVRGRGLCEGHRARFGQCNERMKGRQRGEAQRGRLATVSPCIPHPPTAPPAVPLTLPKRPLCA